MLHPVTSKIENETSERSCISIATCSIQNWTSEPSFNGQNTKIGINSAPFPRRYILNFLKSHMFNGFYLAILFILVCASTILNLSFPFQWSSFHIIN